MIVPRCGTLSTRTLSGRDDPYTLASSKAEVIMMKRAKESAPKGRPATLSRVNSGSCHRGRAKKRDRLFHNVLSEYPKLRRTFRTPRTRWTEPNTHALLRGIIDSTIDAIWAVDPENFGLLTWNRSWEQFFLAARGIVLKARDGPARTMATWIGIHTDVE